MSRSTTSRRRAVALAGSGAIVVTGAGAALLAPVAAGASATFTVDSVNDSGPGSLRQAILDANGAGGHDVIEFAPSLTGVITLASDLPTITEELSIHGNGVAVIDGGWREGGSSGNTVLAFLGVSGSVDVSGVDITGGEGVYGRGGAIFVGGGSSADVTVSDSVLHANHAPAGGGAIFVGSTGATVSVLRSIVAGNTTDYNGGGGGVYVSSAVSTVVDHTSFLANKGREGGGLYFTNPGGDIVVSDSEFDGNASLYEGGAIHVANGDLTISGSTFTGNHSASGGGALYIDAGDSLITDSSFTQNAATTRGGAIFAGNQTLTVRRTTIADNDAGSDGGGIAASTHDGIVVEESTISGNVAGGDGGGIYAFYLAPTRSGSVVAVNSTISGNEAGGTGGAILASPGGTVLVADTITGNSAAGAVDGIAVKTVGIGSVAADPVPTPGVVSLVSTILAGNGDADLGRATGPVDPTVTADHSLVGTSSVTVTNLGGTVTGVAAAALKLGPLADNGGPTLTHALLAGSPALNAGPASLPSFEGDAYDQRGEPYVRVYGGTVDIGAYEEQPRPQPEPVPEPTFTG